MECLAWVEPLKPVDQDWQEQWDGTHEEYELGINLTKDELNLVVSHLSVLQLVQSVLVAMRWF